jgi:hypothetical protein
VRGGPGFWAKAFKESEAHRLQGPASSPAQEFGEKVPAAASGCGERQAAGATAGVFGGDHAPLRLIPASTPGTQRAEDMKWASSMWTAPVCSSTVSLLEPQAIGNEYS